LSNKAKKLTTNDCMDAEGRATQEQLPRHEGPDDLFLHVLRVFVVNIKIRILGFYKDYASIAGTAGN